MGYTFLNRMCRGWQSKPWMKLDDVTPYNVSHRRQRGSLEFVSEYHFKCYHGGVTSTNIHKHSKRKKLYWKLHPQYQRW